MFTLLLGHLTGDYLLQNRWMALNKSKNSLNGWLAAFVHCIIYTAAVCLFMWNFDMVWIGVVFASHFPIDKFSLADKFMQYFTGGSMKDYAQKDNTITHLEVLVGSFTALRYLIIDNGLHILIMWAAYQLIY